MRQQLLLQNSEKIFRNLRAFDRKWYSLWNGGGNKPSCFLDHQPPQLMRDCVLSFNEHNGSRRLQNLVYILMEHLLIQLVDEKVKPPVLELRFQCNSQFLVELETTFRGRSADELPKPYFSHDLLSRGSGLGAPP